MSLLIILFITRQQAEERDGSIVIRITRWAFFVNGKNYSTEPLFGDLAIFERSVKDIAQRKRQAGGTFLKK